MRSTQEKWVERIRLAAEDAGFELVHDPQWGNTGVVRVEGKRSFEPLAEISYNFQSGYCSFDRITGLGMEPFRFVPFGRDPEGRRRSLEEVTAWMVEAIAVIDAPTSEASLRGEW